MLLDGIVLAASLAHVDAAVIDLRVGNNEHASALVHAARELSVELEPAGGQRSVGDDVTSSTVDTDGLSDLDDLQQVGADGYTDLGLRGLRWWVRAGVSWVGRGRSISKVILVNIPWNINSNLLQSVFYIKILLPMHFIGQLLLPRFYVKDHVSFCNLNIILVNHRV